MDQTRIDSIYEAIKPDEQDAKRYDFVIPSRVKNAFAGVAPGASSVDENVRILNTKLGVQKVVVVTLISLKDQIQVRCEVVDASTGQRVKAPVETVVNGQTLERELRKPAYGALGARGSGKSAP